MDDASCQWYEEHQAMIARIEESNKRFREAKKTCTSEDFMKLTKEHSAVVKPMVDELYAHYLNRPMEPCH